MKGLTPTPLNLDPSTFDDIIINGLGDASPCYSSVHNLNSLVYLEGLPSLDTLNWLSLTGNPSRHSVRPLPIPDFGQDNRKCSSFGSLPFASRHPVSRPLIDTVVLSDEMNISTPSIPSSPPGLTHSRSSSFHTSSFSGVDANLPDFDHFEDISLTKESGLARKDRSYDDSAKRITQMMNGGKNDVATPSLRDLTLGDKRQVVHNGSVKGNKALGLGPAHALSMPVGPNNLTRKFSTSSGLARRAMSNHSRSRSPSPSPSAPPSPFSPTQSAPLAPFPPPPRATSNRRGSWQPNRKTAREIEEEYDDTDEDLPDDASLWNVPLSPRPPAGGMINPTSTRTMGLPSSTGPERVKVQSPRLGNTGLGALSASQVAGSATSYATLSNGFSSTPVSPQRYCHRSSTHPMSNHHLFPKSRAKSWTVAMSELSEDAQHLTEALGGLAESSMVTHEASMPKTSSDLQRAKTSMDLPPLRTNDVMIDPLPVSKEKERVLSRTRPSWLPPKSQKEERRHLKEYQRMMEMSLQTEKRKAARAANARCAKDDTQDALQRIWQEHVLPKWDHVIREPRTRELWWRGIASRSRAEVWRRAIGNDLALTTATYTRALQRSQAIEAQIAKGGKYEQCRERTWFDAIHRDIKATLPELKKFQRGDALHDDLTKVLMAYCMYRSDVGYSHGTHLIAAILLLNYPAPSHAFLSLCNLLNRPLPLAFLTGDPAATEKAYSLTLALLSSKYPHLHDRLFEPGPSGLGLSPHEVLEPMMRTLFLGPGEGLGVDIVTRVWDVMVFDGDGVLIRTAVALLGALEGSLYGERQEVLNKLGWRGGAGSSTWRVGGEEEFMAKVRSAGKEERRRL